MAPQSTLQSFAGNIVYLSETKKGFNSGSHRFQYNANNPLYNIDIDKPGPCDY